MYRHGSGDFGRNHIDHTTKKLFLLTFGIIIIFVGIQFIKLATVGRIGSQISQTKSKQDQIELQNEILRMQINELRSSSALTEDMKSEKELVKKEAIVIKPSSSDTIAQGN